MITVTAIAVTVIALGKHTEHIGEVGTLDKPAIEHLLPEVIKFVG
jgi:hypothetical protein